MSDRPHPRRRFLALLAFGLAAAAGTPRRLRATGKAIRGNPHPAPRPGITAAKVLRPGQLDNADAREAYDQVRQIPQIVDGIRCHCGCAELEGYYSLLTCYEEKGMAQHCQICQGQGKLAYRLHQQGWTLDGIRNAIDVKYGD
jgi:hypothetical protein